MLKSCSLGELMKTTSTKTKVECVEKPTVNIPSKIFSDIYYLHSIYPGQEWSGYLYFNKRGDITDPSNLIIDVQEFVLLDLGTVGATEIDPTGEQIVDMYEKKPQILTMKSGLIHTHHKMNTFFSGTDWNTLLENATNYDFFLSIIVNNEGATIGKISLIGSIEEPQVTHKYKFKFNRGFVEKEKVFESKTTEVIYVYDCNINIENSVKEDFDKIKERKDTEKSLTILNQKEYSFNKNRSVIDDWDIPEPKRSVHPYSKNWEKKPHKQYKEDFQTTLFNEKDDLSLPSRPTTKDLTLTFLMALLLQDDDLEFIELESAMTYAQAVKLWDEEVGIEMIEEFKEYITQVVDIAFENIFGEEINEDDFIDIKIHISVVMGSTIQEQTVKEVVENYFKTLKFK